MSLKAFHIVFIALSVVLAFGFGIWLINAFAATGDSLQVAGGIISLVAGAGLIVYGLRFLRKLKHVGML